MRLSELLIMRQMSQNPRRKLYAIRPILAVMTPKRIARFEAKVDRSAACHLWRGGRNSAGYGIVQGCNDYQAFSLLAHRIAWALAHQQEPGVDDVIRHACDNPPCCNPAHLLIGDRRDNHQDMVERGRRRTSHGPRGPHQKNHGMIERAHHMRYAMRLPLAVVAEQLGVHRATVHRWLGPA